MALVEFDHPAGAEHSDPDHEVSAQESISFVEDGTFDAHVDDARWTLGPGTLFVTRPGFAFRCRHVDDVPTDRCLTVSYSDHAVEDLMRVDLPPLRPPLARMSARRQCAVQLIETDYARLLTLGDLASAAGLSTFYLRIGVRVKFHHSNAGKNPKAIRSRAG